MTDRPTDRLVGSLQYFARRSDVSNYPNQYVAFSVSDSKLTLTVHYTFSWSGAIKLTLVILTTKNSPNT